MLDNKIYIAARLKEARIKLCVNSGDFALKSGIDPRNYSSIETGKRAVGERILRDICSAFPIDINWLLTGDGEMLKTNVQQIEQNNPNMISIPADVWDVIKNQAASLKSKDEQTFEALRQSAEMLEMLKEQNKKTNAPQAVTAKCADAV